MALSPHTIATNIAALTIASVMPDASTPNITIKDLNGIIPNVRVRDMPLLMPAPEVWSGLDVTRESMGPASDSKTDVRYLLHYRLFYSPVGHGVRGIWEIYQGLVQTGAAIVDAIIANDDLAGAIDIMPDDVPTFGTVVDPSDAPFFGADFSFRVLEYED